MKWRPPDLCVGSERRKVIRIRQKKCSSLQIKDKESREKRKDERLSFLAFTERT